MPLKHPLYSIFLTCPSNIQITPSAQAVTLGESIDFTVTADDESGGSLTYTWDFGDGNTDSGTSVSHTYAASGTYDVTVTVTNSVGGSATESISINVSDVPYQQVWLLMPHHLL